jgi:ribosomal protein L11 methyltransferase
MPAPSYHVIHLQVPADGTDRIEGILYDVGCLGLEEVESGEGLVLKAYFEATDPLEELKRDLTLRFPDGLVREATTIGLTDASFRPAAFDPFPLVSMARVLPPPELIGGENLVRSPYDILLMPGLAFGTGRHETTRLVARALWHLKPRPASVLDVGTGSGVLALLARKMGVPRVAAVDISEEALENAHGNFLRNGCGDISLHRSMAEAAVPFDSILGNLLTPTILHLKEELVRALAPEGRIILSGITLDEAEDVEKAFREFRLLQRNDTEVWTCLTLQRPD